MTSAEATATPQPEIAFIGGAGGTKQYKWSGATCAPDGNIYCAPFHADSVLVINTKTKEINFIEGAGMGQCKWAAAACGNDGNIYCAPSHADSVLVINTEKQAISFIEGAGSGG